MKKGSYVCLTQAILSIIFLVLNIFVFNITKIYVFFAVTLISAVVLFFLSGYEKNTYRNKMDVLYSIITNVILYFIITYIFGIITGFYRNGYSLTLVNIIKNCFPYALIIVTREFYRYLYFTKTKTSKILMFLGIVFLVLLDVNLNIHLYDINTTMGLTKMICLVFFTSIAKNIFLSFVTLKVGFENTIFYSCVMELKKFILPIFPDFGMYINTILDVVFPLYLTINISDKFKFFEKRRILTSRYHKKNLIFYAIITFALLTIIILTSGYFKYYALTIGSGSMIPKINKGDVVIVKKIKQKNLANELKLNDVLVYNYNNKIIVHRLIEIKHLDGQDYYVTKGDNNLTKDAYHIKPKDVIGIVSFRIRYIGIPTVALNERIQMEG